MKNNYYCEEKIVFIAKKKKKKKEKSISINTVKNDEKARVVMELKIYYLQVVLLDCRANTEL